MAIWVGLTPEQLARAEQIGTARQRNAERIGARHRNNLASISDLDLQRHISAAKCEYAAHLGLKTKYWNTGEDYNGGPKKPDLDGFIEVRQRKISRHNLIIQLDDPKEWAYLSVCSEQEPDYCIDVWCWGHEIQHERYKKSLVASRPAFVINPADLVMKGPSELIQVIQSR